MFPYLQNSELLNPYPGPLSFYYHSSLDLLVNTEIPNKPSIRAVNKSSDSIITLNDRNSSKQLKKCFI